MWIIKPAASSCGRGIRLIHKDNLATVGSKSKSVVQRYMDKPHLINGTKYDLRLYVVMTSVDPLRVYLFEHGLVRFSTSKYSMSARSLKSRYTHLTNYSINKKSKNFVSNEGGLQEDGTGSKWSLHARWRHLNETLGMSAAQVAKVQEDIKDVVVKTLIAAEADVAPAMERNPSRTRGLCYELYGFDIILDAALKPWLLEVNISPSLMGSSPLDREIKGTLMADIFHLVGYVPYDGKQVTRDEKKTKANKLRGINDGRSKALLSRRQDAWRRNPSPESIALAELQPEDWEVVYESEDEFARRGHFERLFRPHALEGHAAPVRLPALQRRPARARRHRHAGLRRHRHERRTSAAATPRRTRRSPRLMSRGAAPVPALAAGGPGGYPGALRGLCVQRQRVRLGGATPTPPSSAAGAAVEFVESETAEHAE